MAIRLPKRFANNYILKLISFPPQKEDFLPLVVNGKQVPPKISLEIQKRIRDTCRLAGIDAETVVGLPPLPEIKMPKHYLAKGSKREIEKVKRL
jgi:hypothetical protein